MACSISQKRERRQTARKSMSMSPEKRRVGKRERKGWQRSRKSVQKNPARYSQPGIGSSAEKSVLKSFFVPAEDDVACPAVGVEKKEREERGGRGEGKRSRRGETPPCWRGMRKIEDAHQSSPLEDESVVVVVVVVVAMLLP